MKHILQEILLVLIITVICITTALFIAQSVQSEPLRVEDNTSTRHSKDNSIIHGADASAAHVIDDGLKEKL